LGKLPQEYCAQLLPETSFIKTSASLSFEMDVSANLTLSCKLWNAMDFVAFFHFYNLHTGTIGGSRIFLGGDQGQVHPDVY